MSKLKLYDKRGILTDEAMEQFEKRGSSVPCECPEHLVALLRQAKEFTKYQQDCLLNDPSDKIVHEWLKTSSINLEHLISSTIVTLARMEGMLDDNNEMINP